MGRNETTAVCYANRKKSNETILIKKTMKKDNSNNQINDQIVQQDIRDDNSTDFLFEKLQEMGAILLINDYHTDFKEIMSHSSVFEYNIECEITYYDIRSNTTESLPWIDIYTGLDCEHVEEGVQRGSHDQGFEGAHSPKSGNKLQIVPAKGEVPEIIFETNLENDYHTCYPQTDKLFGKTVKQCACAWAELQGLTVPVENVIVGDAEMFQKMVVQKLKPQELPADFLALNSELAIRLGLTTEEKVRQQEQEIDDKAQSPVSVRLIKPLTPEQEQQMIQTAGPEAVERLHCYTVEFNAKSRVASGDPNVTLHDLVIAQDRVEPVREMLERPTDVNQRDADEKTPLFYAVQNNKLELVRLLLEFHADPNIPDNKGCPPIFWSLADETGSVLDLLLKAGADVNALDPHGVSPLFVAIQMKNRTTALALVGAGADLTVVINEASVDLRQALFEMCMSEE